MSSENRDVTPQSDDCDQATSAGPTLIEQDHMEGSYATEVMTPNRRPSQHCCSSVQGLTLIRHKT